MKIVKCVKCKKYIHKLDQCLYCGNTVDFEEVELPRIHENAVREYSMAESWIENKQFDIALIVADVVMEWMPNLASIFWLRLLAKNKCTNDIELIQKGFDCEKDADFCNAFAFSTGAEHETYLNVKNTVLAIKNALRTEISKNKYRCEIKTDILQLKKSMKEEVDSRKKKLFLLWSELEKIEHSMYMLEKDCALLSKEYSNALNRASETAASIKAETYQLKECTAENYHKYQVRIGNTLQQSKEAKEAIDNMKVQHPKVKTFEKLVKKRDEQVQEIVSEIASLKKYEATVQQTLDKVDRIEQRHHAAICAVNSFDFLDAASLLGEDKYNHILRSSGLEVDDQMLAFYREWQSDVTDADTGDYYNTLFKDSY